MIIYNEELTERVQKLKKQNETERLILELEKELNKSPDLLEKIKALKKVIEDLENQLPNDSDKKYLADIILEEKIQFGTNNLILAPIGSGKSTLIRDVLIDPKKGKYLILVSTRFLKESVVQSDLSSENPLNIKPTKLGGNPSVLLMTYHEFGIKIKDSNEFVEDIDTIFCDEIHSLPEYRDYNGPLSQGLIKYSLEHAMKYLFNHQPGKQIFYFTATDENFESLKEKRPNMVSKITTYDFRNHPDIKKYMELSKAYISHIEQVRPFLKERKESFEYFKSKGLAFGRTIRNLKVIEHILIEEGYKPLVLWSDKSEEKMSKEQIEARKELISTNKIPDKYNFLVINSALREGWDLKDPSVRMAIMNTTNETDSIQARGRIRKDIDLIVYKLTEDIEKLFEKEIVDKYIGVPLSASDKEEFCNVLQMRDKKNRLLKWRAIKKILEDNGYDVSESKVTRDGVRIRASIITVKTTRD